MTDILRRLHCTIRCDIETAESGCHCAEGRDTITALTARVKELEAMLRTASDMNEVYEGRLQELEGENKNLKLMVEVLRKALKESPND